MADYYPLIQRAIAGLDKNTGEARRALYERARTALVAQLRGVDPPLQEAEITRERLALEEAIRKVEAEAARRTRADAPAAPSSSPSPSPTPSAPRFPNAAGPTPQQPPQSPRSPNGGPVPAAQGNRPAPPRPQGPAGAPPPKAPPAAGPQKTPLGAPPAGAKPSGPPPKFPPAPPRGPTPPAGKPKPPFATPPATPGGPPSPGAARPSRDPFAEIAAGHELDRLMEPRLAQEDFNRAEGPAADPFRELPPSRSRPPRDMQEEGEDDEEAEEGGRRGIGGLVKAAVAIVLVLAIGWVAWSQRGLVTDMLTSFRGSSTQQATKDSKSGQPTTGRPKITDRLGSQDAQSGPAVAQRVVLYEEEPSDPQGKRYVGSAIWRTETVSPGPGRPPELAIRADVEIPERHLNMSFSIRRNTDQTLPASHTMEVMFNLPADFAPGGISNVPGVLMKQAEQTRGTPLAGLAVKVTNNFFLIGLSAVESDQARNIQLLKERGWFDIPIVYNNNRRAILAIEKGTPGERAFQEAFAAWKQ
ncbi:hypothetical protein [Pseudorhodoplanes sp.]|uniref:hypothetical protein n=1 Tax=Pseudorhodoplanes sp. TaxID=1934341 RepID=UPI002BB24B9A|nr:hypothetical protein [Pseudorhodoplanes sp.]HWV41241.1 hypothetical protein [Pseudorhodoplanes sp.]